MRAELGVLYVPVRVCACDIVSIRTGCLPSGQQVGLAFTAQGKLAAAVGLGHASVRIHVRALSEMLKPRGITQVIVDARCLHCLPGATFVPALDTSAPVRQLTRETALRPRSPAAVVKADKGILQM